MVDVTAASLAEVNASLARVTLRNEQYAQESSAFAFEEEEDEDHVEESVEPESFVTSGAIACPCCRYRSLRQSGVFQVCVICGWEEDGKDEERKNEVLGNNKVSLVQARNNFKQYLTIYDESNLYLFTQVTEEQILYKKERVCIGLEERDLGPDNEQDFVDFDAVFERVALIRLKLAEQDVKQDRE